MQQYLLDFDDVLAASFMTQSNAANLINGVNLSGVNVGFAVNAGGTGNTIFTPGQTIVFDGERLVSSGAGPASTGALTNDDRYYTKSEVDAFFAGLGLSGGTPVAWSNITGAPLAGMQVSFLTPVQFYSGTAIMTSPVELPLTPISGHTIVAAIITVTGLVLGPISTVPAKFMVQENLASTQIDAGWFLSSVGVGAIEVAGCSTSIVPVDPTAQSFFYQQIGNSVSPGPIVAKVIGLIYK